MASVLVGPARHVALSQLPGALTFYVPGPGSGFTVVVVYAGVTFPRFSSNVTEAQVLAAYPSAEAALSISHGE